MTICDLQSGLGQIAQAATRLQAQVAAAQAQWHDEASRGFAAAHLREIPERLQRYALAVQRLAAAVEQAERECSDEPASQH